MLRSAALAAIVGTAAAFTPAGPMGLRMQADTGVSRREAIQGAVAGAALFAAGAPALAQPVPGVGYAAKKKEVRMKNENYAPVITVFDHRGCNNHENKEYTGKKANDENDEMLVKVKQTKLKRDDPKFQMMADKVAQEVKGQMFMYPVRDVGY